MRLNEISAWAAITFTGSARAKQISSASTYATRCPKVTNSQSGANDDEIDDSLVDFYGSVDPTGSRPKIEISHVAFEASVFHAIARN